MIPPTRSRMSGSDRNSGTERPITRGQGTESWTSTNKIPQHSENQDEMIVDDNLDNVMVEDLDHIQQDRSLDVI